ncbi:MAG: RNA polymerase sigma factor [Polyangiales bacterium]
MTEDARLQWEAASDPGAVLATHAAIEAVWRVEASRLIAGLARITRDVETAEELAGDALVAALEQWPRDGIPANPGAWLMAAGRNRAIDAIRRRETLARRTEALAREAVVEQGVAVAAASAVTAGGEADDVGDDLLRLVLVACHPVLSVDARVALTLRLVGGLTTDEIARAFLVPEPTVAQRIVRAKRTLTEAHVPFEVPGPAELPARLAAVLEVIYLVFNEGYAATTGDTWMRPGLCDQALRLGRVLAELAPAEPEVHGLVALMEIQASRLRARVDAVGRPIRLLEQDRTRWDRLLIRRGLAALDRADRLGGARGPYALQAAIAACHARALRQEHTDWARIAALYDALAAIGPSPVVELNRAVAVAQAYGPEAGLAVVEALDGEPALRDYHLLPAVRGDLLARLGRGPEAAVAFRAAAALARNERERTLLEERAASAERGSPALS